METNSPSTACLTNFALVAYQRACVYMCGLTCVCPCWMEVDVGFLFYDSLPNVSGQGFSLSLEFTVWMRVAGYRTPKIFLSLPAQYTGIVGTYCQIWLSMGPGGLNLVLMSLWQTLCPWSHLPNCNECSGKKCHLAVEKQLSQEPHCTSRLGSGEMVVGRKEPKPQGWTSMAGTNSREGVGFCLKTGNRELFFQSYRGNCIAKRCKEGQILNLKCW